MQLMVECIVLLITSHMTGAVLSINLFYTAGSKGVTFNFYFKLFVRFLESHYKSK